jgi:hypothetical protein
LQVSVLRAHAEASLAMSQLNAHVQKNKEVAESAPKKKRSRRTPGKRTTKENVNGGIKPWLAASIQKLKGVKKTLKPKDVCLVLKQAFLTNFPDMAEIAEMTLSPGASGGAAQSITFTVNKPLGKDDVIVL